MSLSYNTTPKCAHCGRPTVGGVCYAGAYYHRECVDGVKADREAMRQNFMAQYEPITEPVRITQGYVTIAECDRMIAEAVATEREACATISERVSIISTAMRSLEARGRVSAADEITVSIRNRKGAAIDRIKEILE